MGIFAVDDRRDGIINVEFDDGTTGRIQASPGFADVYKVYPFQTFSHNLAKIIGSINDSIQQSTSKGFTKATVEFHIQADEELSAVLVKQSEDAHLKITLEYENPREQ